MTLPADDRAGAIAAAAHPLVLVAGVVVVVNDHVLRAVSPGWLTGKLSDAGFLVVAPVFVASALAMVGVPGRWARGVGLIGVAALYTTLQLWAPLGAFVRANHVADPEDLLVLPALLGAVYAWRTARRRAVLGAVALPMLAGVLVATSWEELREASWPCGEGMTWDPAHPLLLQFGTHVTGAPRDTDHFLRGLTLTDGDGTEVALVATGANTAFGTLVCARHGLRGDTDYTWTIGPWDDVASNETRFHHDGMPTVRFRTLPGEGVAVDGPEGCAALADVLDPADGRECGIGVGAFGDTGGGRDTGDSAGTATSGAP
ncbi:MAG: hypothetical protein ACK4YP_17990 [Myxococcota bacterium]